jgi:hypothetical protein
MIPKNPVSAEDKRHAVADHAVAQLKERSDFSRLNEEVPTAKPPSTRAGRKASPDTPPRPPFFKPRPPQPGLIYYLRRLSVSTGHKFAERRRQVVS